MANPGKPSERTLVEVLNTFKEQGYTLDFNLKTHYLSCHQEDLELHPQDFDIVDTVRLEGMSDPDDNMIVYAIESSQGQKGTLIAPYGVYAEDSPSAELAAKLALTHK
ncbi:MAG: phosphoribosylpyrophosphate synthetase [Siphonobacter sp.]